MSTGTTVLYVVSTDSTRDVQMTFDCGSSETQRADQVLVGVL